MKFIELTSSGKVLIVNAAQIVAVYNVGTGSNCKSEITFTGGVEIRFDQTPEEVMARIKYAS